MNRHAGVAGAPAKFGCFACIVCGRVAVSRWRKIGARRVGSRVLAVRLAALCSRFPRPSRSSHLAFAACPLGPRPAAAMRALRVVARRQVSRSRAAAGAGRSEKVCKAPGTAGLIARPSNLRAVQPSGAPPFLAARAQSAAASGGLSRGVPFGPLPFGGPVAGRLPRSRHPSRHIVSSSAPRPLSAPAAGPPPRPSARRCSASVVRAASPSGPCAFAAAPLRAEKQKQKQKQNQNQQQPRNPAARRAWLGVGRVSPQIQRKGQARRAPPNGGGVTRRAPGSRHSAALPRTLPHIEVTISTHTTGGRIPRTEAKKMGTPQRCRKPTRKPVRAAKPGAAAAALLKQRLKNAGLKAQLTQTELWIQNEQNDLRHDLLELANSLLDEAKEQAISGRPRLLGTIARILRQCKVQVHV